MNEHALLRERQFLKCATYVRIDEKLPQLRNFRKTIWNCCRPKRRPYKLHDLCQTRILRRDPCPAASVPVAKEQESFTLCSPVAHLCHRRYNFLLFFYSLTALLPLMASTLLLLRENILLSTLCWALCPNEHFKEKERSARRGIFLLEDGGASFNGRFWAWETKSFDLVWVPRKI